VDQGGSLAALHLCSGWKGGHGRTSYRGRWHQTSMISTAAGLGLGGSTAAGGAVSSRTTTRAVSHTVCSSRTTEPPASLLLKRPSFWPSIFRASTLLQSRRLRVCPTSFLSLPEPSHSSKTSRLATAAAVSGSRSWTDLRAPSGPNNLRT